MTPHLARSFATTLRPSRLTILGVTVLALAGGGAVFADQADATTVETPTVLLPNITVAEGEAGKAAVVVNVGLSAPNPFDHPVTLEVVDYTSVPLPGGGGTYGTATPGSDYVSFGSFDLTFQPGQQVARFKVKVKGDTVVEPNEEIDVRFDDTEFVVGDNDIDLVLANDDGAGTTAKPLLLPPNQTMPEPDAGCFAYQVTMPVSRPVKARATVDAVDYTSVPLPAPMTGTYGTATPGSDYAAFGTRTLVYAAGARTATLPVTICGDTAAEIDEEIDVRFDNTSTLVVQDNDIDLVLSDND